jgi:hypothetical protein
MPDLHDCCFGPSVLNSKHSPVVALDQARGRARFETMPFMRGPYPGT